MEDPTSDVGQVDPEDAPECVVCDDPIAESVTHRVVAWVEDGQAVQRHFCDDDCLAEWTE